MVHSCLSTCTVVLWNSFSESSATKKKASEGRSAIAAKINGKKNKVHAIRAVKVSACSTGSSVGTAAVPDTGRR